MINWKTFNEWPRVDSKVLVTVRDLLFSAIVNNNHLIHNGMYKSFDWLIENRAEWEYVDQIQSKSKDIEIDGHGNKMTVPNG